MEEDFVLYEEALALKVLGFDEKCFGYYENQDKKLVISYNNLPLTEEQEKRPGLYKTDNRNSKLPQWTTTAPTYQQMFRWFRTKRQITHCISRKFIHIPRKYVFDFQIWDDRKPELGGIKKSFYPGGNNYETYEDAELACLKKLIIILK